MSHNMMAGDKRLAREMKALAGLIRKVESKVVGPDRRLLVDQWKQSLRQLCQITADAYLVLRANGQKSAGPSRRGEGLERIVHGVLIRAALFQDFEDMFINADKRARSPLTGWAYHSSFTEFRVSYLRSFRSLLVCQSFVTARNEFRFLLGMLLTLSAQFVAAASRFHVGANQTRSKGSGRGVGRS
jgi:hypothetical protein